MTEDHDRLYSETELQRLRRDAEGGEARAQLGLGLYYLTGNSPRYDIEAAAGWLRKNEGQDFRLALKWLHRAARQGNARAQNYLGNCYHAGIGVKGNYQRAAEWYRKAADQGYPEAVCNLGTCYYYYHGVFQDHDEAIRLFRKASELGCPRADYLLGISYNEGRGVRGNAVKGLRLIKKAAVNGYGKAKWHLGFYYRNREATDEDPARIVERERRLAEQGDAEAQFNLASHYFFGDGAKQDFAMAKRLYRKAANQGYPPAVFRLCYMYKTGNGARRNFDECRKLLYRLARQGNPQAQFALGHGCYGISEMNLGMKTRGKWLTRAAEQGYLPAQYELGDQYGSKQWLERIVEERLPNHTPECWENRENDVDPDFADSMGWLDRQIHSPWLEIPRTCTLMESLRDLELRGRYEDGDAEEWGRMTNRLDCHWEIAHGYYDSMYKRDDRDKYDSHEKVPRKIIRLETKAERGDAEAQYKAGIWYEDYDRSQFYKAIDYLEQAAKQGHAGATYELGILIKAGFIIDQEKDKAAAEQFKKAADLGHLKAFYELGCCYTRGEGVKRDLARGTECFRIAAEGGCAEGQFALGHRYYTGTGVERDLNRAAELFRASAEQDFAPAMFYLGLCYDEGAGEGRHAAEAAELLIESARRSFVPASYRLGIRYLEGNGVDKDPDLAMKWLEDAAGGEKNHFWSLSIENEKKRRSLYNACFLESGKKGLSETCQKKAFEKIRELAAQGEPNALFTLGECYRHGYYTERDDSKASEYRRKAEELVSSDAISVGTLEGLAHVRIWGRSAETEADLDKVVSLYRRAAELGSLYSLERLAFVYYLGDGPENHRLKRIFHWDRIADYVDRKYTDKKPGSRTGAGVIEKNVGKALELAGRGAQRGSCRCMFLLGHSFRYGIGVERNHSEAVKWLKRAARKGHPDAAYLLALCYQNGEGVEKEREQAVTWFKKAAHGRHEDAMLRLGLYYSDPGCPDPDRAAGLNWFWKTHGQYHRDVLYQMGWCYTEGEGVEQDKEAGAEWYKKAAELGHEKALLQFGLYCLNGDDAKPDRDERKQWFLEKSEKSFPDVLFRLAECCRDGNGVRKDGKKWRDLCKRAAEAGSGDAIIYSARQYLKNGNRPKQETERVKIYRMALTARFFPEKPAVRFALGRCYYYGSGTFQDFDHGLNLMREAADDGCEEAKAFLADIGEEAEKS